jgi:hypothetical protein
MSLRVRKMLPRNSNRYRSHNRLVRRHKSWRKLLLSV